MGGIYRNSQLKQGLSQHVFVFSCFLAQIKNYEKIGAHISNLYLFLRYLSLSKFLSRWKMAVCGNLGWSGMEK